MTSLGNWLMYRVHGETVHPRKTRRTRARRGPARNWKYRAWIRTLPCLVCGRDPYAYKGIQDLGRAYLRGPGPTPQDKVLAAITEAQLSPTRA